MLNLINSHAHGFTAVPVVLALRARGAFGLLAAGAPMAPPALAHALGANEGQLRVALRMLHSLGWLQRCPAGYTATAAAHLADQVPEPLLQLYELPIGSAGLLEDATFDLPHWLQLARDGWRVTDGRLTTLLDGALLVPLLFALRARGLPRAGDRPPFEGLAPALHDALLELLVARGWCAGEGRAARLTEPGRHLFERMLVLGVTASYAPLLAKLPQLIFGDAALPFARDGSAHESHVDRSLNVVASGFQHQKYFEAFATAAHAMFDRLPLEQQPAAVADMGAGDGTLLLRLYRHIVEHTARGRALTRHPLVMIAVDYNQEALAVAGATLATAGVPHRLLLGDVADPERLDRDLQALDGIDAANVLHVRSFLDHDRPWQPPAPTPALQQRLRQRQGAGHEGVFVAPDGSAIAPELALQALAEHLRRWAGLCSRHGLLVLEVHCLGPATVARHLDSSESLHFDALQGFSRQQLVEAPDFLLAAAEAGLFARPGFPQRFPRTLPFCRITLNWFEARDYTLRLAAEEDVEALLALEEACWPQPLRASATTLRQRLLAFPRGQCVIELDGRVVAAIYSQRVASVEALAAACFAELADLHRNDGQVLQLLAVNVLPDVQHLGLGDQLLEFILQYAGLFSGLRSVAGVTRCLQFATSGAADVAEYVGRRTPGGEPLDPVLAFHAHHGARIERVLQDWRPQDTANRGYGVLIRYDLLDRRTDGAMPRPPTAPGGGAAAIVESCVRDVLGQDRAHRFSADTTFRDMGLDSLDLLELRTGLAQASGLPLEPTFFFRHTTPAAAARFLHPHCDDPAPVATSTQDTLLPEPAATPAAAGAEPIAIIGIGCRFPGGAGDADAFWRLLVDGRDSIGEAPATRGNGELAVLAARTDLPGVRLGGWLPQADHFDPGFFGIAPREARAMDPQQRLLLEVGWDALEHAGIAPSGLEGSSTGVFVGLFGHDYEALRHASATDDDLDLHFSTGVAPSVAAGRLAYVLGLRGPALAVDTACSSSLMALHLACRSLQSGESTLALAGGVNLILDPASSIAFARAGMLAPDGRCRTFDQQASGYVRGEGCGVVVLKPLGRAVADGDTVYAVVRGSAANQDGRSNGLTAPNGGAQEAVLRAALRSAGVDPAQVQYVEAHGTGTPLGDPVEMQALQAVYGSGRSTDAPLRVGSVKTNIGHTEAAAGIAGLLKVALGLHHGCIPPHLHLRQPSAGLDLAQPPTAIPTEVLAWPQTPRRLAGLSAFGYSGTNVHVVLEAAPPAAPQRLAAGHAPGPYLLTVSAHDDAALAERSAGLARALQREAAPVAAICRTANAGRTVLGRRIAVTGSNASELAEALASRRAVAGDRPLRVAFLFTGQGAQYHGMGAELLRKEPVFRHALEECEALLREEAAPALPPLHELLYGAGADPRLHQTACTQPALFSFGHALAKLWDSWGIRPDAVLGHSVGEFAAACHAGLFNLREGLQLVAARGRLMQALPAGGAMASLRAGPDTVAHHLERAALPLEIAGYNGPAETVVSGPELFIAAALEAFAAIGVRGVRLQTSHAFHSRAMEPMLEAFRETCAGVRWQPPRLAHICGVTGALAGPEVADPAYWVAQARQPVRFAQGMATLTALGCDTFLEIGPRPVLVNLGRAAAPDVAARWLPSLVPGTPERASMYAALGELYEAGADVAWNGVHHGIRPAPAVLPPYPFQRQRYWLRPPGQARATAPRPVDGPPSWRGHRLPLASPVAVFEHPLAAMPPFAREHRLHGAAVLPAAAVLHMGMAAATQLAARLPAAWTFSSLVLGQALELPAATQARPQLVLVPQDGGHGLRLLGAAADGAWATHAEGFIAGDTAFAADHGEALVDLRVRLSPAAVADCVRSLEAQGLTAPTAVAAWRELRLADGEALACIEAGDAGTALDAALMAALPALGGRVHLLTGMEIFQWRTAAEPVAWCHARRIAGADTPTVDLRLLDADGALLARAGGCRFAALGPRAPDWTDWLYRPHWEPAPLPATTALAVLAAGLEHACAPTADEAATAGLEALARQWLLAALHELGWKPAAGDTCAPEALAATLGVVPAQRRLFMRLLQILQEDGLLTPHGQLLRVATLPAASRSAAETLLEVLVQQLPHSVEELQLLARCGRALAPVLRGTQAPVTVLFPADDPHQLTRLYQHGPSFAPLQALLATALERLLTRWPSGAPLRILEIGAGTGGSTAAALEALPAERCAYTFTDLSPHFLNAARERFGGRAGMEFRRLDIERSPQTQGFQGGHYDLVIAANVLHATRDLGASLDHARSLLAPGGVLLLLEGTARRRWIDLTFGLLEGWWRFADGALRPDYPLLASAQWSDLLRAQFDDATVVTPAGSQSMPLPQSLLLAGRSALPASTLVFADAGGLGDRIAGLLTAAGRAVTLVRPSNAYHFDPAEATLDPFDAEHHRRLLADLGLQPAAVVHLWARDLGPEDGGDGCASALHLVQALAARGHGAGTLWLVTQGAQDVTGGAAALAPFQAPLWGLGLAITREHPELSCRMVDLDPEAGPGAADDLWRELQHPGPGREWRSGWRAGERHEPHLARLAPPSPVPVALAGGCHLVTGGTGGIGRHIAASLVARGARVLVLASRHATAAAGSPWLAALRASGAAVHLHDCDVGAAGEVDALLAWIAREAGPLQGVYHCAGAFSDALLLRQVRARFQQAFRAKALGAWHLHLATRGLPLQAFVLCSSAFSLLPSAGLASYAAANAFLDVLAAQRRREGLPALSVNWGPWTDVGMAAALGPARARQWAASGIATLAPGAALQALERLQGSGVAQAAVMDIDWQRLAGEAPAAAMAAAPNASAPLLERLQAAPAGQQDRLLLQHVVSLAASVLGFPDAGRLDVRRSLFTLGMDSLTAMELRGRLQHDLRLPLPATLLLEHPAPAALARHLHALLHDTEPAAAAPQPEPPAQAGPRPIDAELAEIEQLLRGLG